MASLKERKKTLETRLAELEGRLNEIEHELDEPIPKDWEEAAQEREDDEVLESMGTAGLHEIDMIRAALERVEANTYGECVKCGGVISNERLNVVPATPFCRHCAM